ncbi:MAG: hypothetical protein ACYTGC_15280 [Planctomycetota bacterium]|jgi:hypothetical protein
MGDITIADRIAAEAARLFEDGRAPTVRGAIRLAADRLELADAPWPSVGRVRQHVQARSMQELGAEGYRERVAGIYEVAEEVMAALEEGLDDARTLLVGRAARGHVDGDGRLHVRAYTECDIGEIAEVLVSFGYDEPAFETADTRHGRLSRLRLIDEDQEIVVTRCLPSMYAARSTNLFTGAPIECQTRDQVRRRTYPMPPLS